MRRMTWLVATLAACGGSDGAPGDSPAVDASGLVDAADAGGRGDASDASGRGDASDDVPSACGDEPLRTGEATYYAADGTGNCSFDASPRDLMVAAMNREDYGASAACGACVRVAGPNGEITVRIVDQCPECARGALDLSAEAFDRIAARVQGRVAVRWRYVPCDVSGALRFRFKEGSSQYWTAVQVRNHRQAIAKLEVEKAGAFVSVARESYNYFVAADGMGPGPYTFRVTDVHGESVVERGIALRVGQEVSGSQQLPVCAAP